MTKKEEETEEEVKEKPKKGKVGIDPFVELK